MINFASDNASGVHPDVFKKMIEVNDGTASPYGADMITKNAEKIMKDVFGNDTYPFFVFNGTGANAVALNLITDQYSMVLCPAGAHVIEDECGAPSKSCGCYMKRITEKPGKLTVKDLEPYVEYIGNVHKSQPRAITISQITECGLVYSIEELALLSGFCKKNNLLIHMDGARLANAAVLAENPLLNLRETMRYVDVLSLGGTKNGLMCAEAIIIKDKTLADKFAFVRKQNTQLPSKMRFISAQFLAFFENNLWINLAKNANMMTTRLCNGIKEHVNVLYDVNANIIFAEMKTKTAKELLKVFYFYIVSEKDDKSVVRLIPSWNTTEKEVDMLIDGIKKYQK